MSDLQELKDAIKATDPRTTNEHIVVEVARKCANPDLEAMVDVICSVPRGYRSDIEKAAQRIFHAALSITDDATK